MDMKKLVEKSANKPIQSGNITATGSSTVVPVSILSMSAMAQSQISDSPKQ